MSNQVVEAHRQLSAANVFRTTVATSISELEELSEAWQRLWAEDAKREIFGSYAWVRAWWQANGQGKTLCTPVVRQGNRVVGILPLVQKGTELSFLGDPDGDYNDLLCAPGLDAEVLEAALDSLFTMKLAWRSCVLRDVPENAHLRVALPQIASRFRRWIRVVPGNPCPTLVFDDNKQEIITAIVSKDRFRKDKKRLSKLGSIRFCHLENRTEIKKELPVFLKQYWRRRALAGQFNLDRYRASGRFYEALLEGLDPGSELRFSMLEVGGRPLAYHFGFEVNGKFILYKPTFDVDFWDYSAGSVLNCCLFEYARKEGISEFDFTRGEEAYKKYFVNRTKYNLDIVIERPGLGGWFRHAGTNVVAAVKQTAQQTKLHRSLKQLWRVAPLIRRGQEGRRLTHHAKQGAARLWRSLVFDVREQLLFRADDQGSDAAGAAASGLVLRQGGVADLADYALQFAAEWDSNRFAELRNRLKAGHRLYVLAAGERIAGMAWVRAGDGAAEEFGISGGATPHAPAAIVFEPWTDPQAGQKLGFELLVRLAAAGHAQGHDVWLLCGSGAAVSRPEVEAAGFRLHTKRAQFRLFHWIKLNRIRHYPT